MKDLAGQEIVDPVERAFLAALAASQNRPAGLPLIEEEELDVYVTAVEQSARCIADEFNRPDLVARWL